MALGDDQEGERLVNEFSRAGAVVRYIHRHVGWRSPVLAQELNMASGHHDFSFVCPETRRDLPRYRPIGSMEVATAAPVLACCTVCYVDRLSGNILDAMNTASCAGAIVFFEPSDVEDEYLFAEALRMTSVLKYSAERLGERLSQLQPECVRIITHGAKGLEIADGESSVWCNAVHAPSVLDTCGSGDMVSVGVIDWMLTRRPNASRLKVTDLIHGIVPGQHLAAENCAYAGARGFFKQRGADYVRQLLRARLAAG